MKLWLCYPLIHLDLQETDADMQIRLSNLEETVNGN